MDTLVEAGTTLSVPPAPQSRTHRLALIAAGSEADVAVVGAGLATRPVPEGDDEPIRRYVASTADATRWAALLADGAEVTPVDFGGTVGDNDGARPVTLMFPGLGDHYLDMGRDLYRQFPVFRDHVDYCCELLRDTLDVDLRTVIFSAAERPAEGIDLRQLLGRGGDAPSPEQNQLNRPSIAQPALFVIEYALAQLWQSLGVRPAMLVGYSLGEYVAACLADVLSLADSLTLVARRAQLIETLPPGAMLAVLMSEDELTPLLGDGVSLAAINGPEFCVVAGPGPAVDELAALLAGRDVITNRVRSTHAFHTPWMASIADQVTALVAGFERRPPRIPFVSNVTGRPITDEEAVDPAYWSRHLCHTVRFADALQALPESGVLLEAGPGQTLSSLATAARPGAAIVSSMRHSLERRSDTAALLTATGRLWMAGADLDWQRSPAEVIVTRAATPAVTPEAELTGTEAELTGTETELIGVWERLLKVSGVTPAARFFDLGGNSMLAARLILRVARAFDVELTLRQIYEHSTVAAMAATIDAERSGVAAPAPVTTTGTGGEVAAPRYRLPNGLLIAQQNEAKTKHFYEDIFDHRTYAKNGITLRDGATVVDVGGNIGLFTLFAHYEARDVRVFTFEPAPPLFEKLSRNVADHGVRATLFNYGLADREDTATFTFYPRSSGMSSFHPDEREEKHNLRTIIANQHAGAEHAIADYADELIDVRFEAVTFDTRLRPLSAVIAELGIEVIDLIKIDVQKSEMQVIEGIADEDWPRIRQLVMEAHDGDGRVAALVSLLESRGFTAHAEQDELYVGTDIRNIYAIRSES